MMIRRLHSMIREVAKAFIAFAVTFFLSFHPLTQALLVLIVADIVTGLTAAYICKTLNSRVTFRGMAKKSLMLTLASLGHYIDRVWNVGFDLGAIISGFYCINELLSVVENCCAAGIPIPAQLYKAIAKIKELESFKCDKQVRRHQEDSQKKRRREREDLLVASVRNVENKYVHKARSDEDAADSHKRNCSDTECRCKLRIAPSVELLRDSSGTLDDDSTKQ